MPRADARPGGPRGRERRGRRLLALLALVAVLAACASAPQGDGDAGERDTGTESAAPEYEATPPPAPPEVVQPLEPPAETPGDEPEPPAPPRTRAELVGQLQRVVEAAHGELDAARLAVLVVDEHGHEVLAHEATTPLLPASTQKLVTAAALLRTLGPDARLSTTAEVGAPMDAGGAVRGDLHLRGTGDPALATDDYARWVYPARPRTPLESLADDLAASGLRRVRGNVVVDADGFDGPMEAAGWPDRYFASLDARRIAGLTVDGGLETIVTFPDGPDLEEDDDEDENEDEPEGARPRPRPDGDEEDLGTPRVRVQPADDPAVQAGVELIRLLEERGVRVDGGAVRGPPERPALGTLARVQSPPMHELLRFMVQQSDNHLADTLHHVIGRVRTGEGSWEGGARASRQVLELLGVDHEGAALADGSGLSRDDRLTARLLVDLDRAMVEGRHAGVWRSLMAVAGESGTLRTRLRGTAAQGRLLGKTGTLNDVAALSGLVEGDEGRRYHFAVLANDARGADRAVVRAMVDELGLLMTSDLIGCRATRDRGADDTPLGQPPVVLRC